ncbi:MAG: Fur family transcriptional regulator [Brevibacterium yomogidense]|uniref:Zinc uptake regulation protein ZUR n=1 Tax=Brevibacterium yomogidense TaxID=946573 RepID=A0A1X6XCE8_9MICO|nr:MULTISPECIES: transcriptional repressor [Brevibacterium]SLM96809.1 Zinc uptake regulation protein ZUR [Brevibacterium yomogidense]
MRRRRRSAQRDSLVAIMDRDRRLISAQELHTNLRAAGAEISLATVYRHLLSLSEKGEIHTVHGRDGEALYRRCGDRLHHHLRCHGCGRTEEITAQVEQDAMLSAAADAGYDDVQFTIELAGRCAVCRSCGDQGHRDA